MRKILYVVVLAFMLALFVTACGGGGSGTKSGKSNWDTMHWNEDNWA